MKNSSIYVWDPLVRVFHWSLVSAFTLAYFTEDDFMETHEVAGYVVLGLVAFRIVWGLIGTRYARFTNFIYKPAAIIQYLKSLKTAHPAHYLGHNPAGGLMVIILLVMLAFTSLTGIKAHDAESLEQAAANPGINISLISSAYADDDHDHDSSGHDHKVDEFWGEVHEVSANLTVLLVILHIVGVLASSKLHRENLVRAMITGYKETRLERTK